MKMITYNQLEQDRQEYIRQQSPKQKRKEYPIPLKPEDLPRPIQDLYPYVYDKISNANTTSKTKAVQKYHWHHFAQYLSRKYNTPFKEARDTITYTLHSDGSYEVKQ